MAVALGVLMALGLAVRSGGRALPAVVLAVVVGAAAVATAVAGAARRCGRRHRRARGLPGRPRHDPGVVVRPRGRRGPRRRAARHRRGPRGGRLPRRHRPGPLRVHRPGPRAGDDRAPWSTDSAAACTASAVSGLVLVVGGAGAARRRPRLHRRADALGITRAPRGRRLGQALDARPPRRRTPSDRGAPRRPRPRLGCHDARPAPAGLVGVCLRYDGHGLGRDPAGRRGHLDACTPRWERRTASCSGWRWGTSSSALVRLLRGKPGRRAARVEDTGHRPEPPRLQPLH